MSLPRDEISRRLATLDALERLVPAKGLGLTEEVKEEMEELISRDYDPYFCGNAALHLSSACQRCGRCCRDADDIAISMEDCRRLARHLSMSLKKFTLQYTRPHPKKGRDVGTARLIRKARGEHCPFHDPDLPGCAVHEAKPQVCSAAFYLSKMNLILCRENGRFSVFPHCPADRKLRAKIDEFRAEINAHHSTREQFQAFFSPPSQVELFMLLLRLKGIEIYFGREKAQRLAHRLRLKRMPLDEELRPAAVLYAASLLEDEAAISKEDES